MPSTYVYFWAIIFFLVIQMFFVKHKGGDFWQPLTMWKDILLSIRFWLDPVVEIGSEITQTGLPCASKQ